MRSACWTAGASLIAVVVLAACSGTEPNDEASNAAEVTRTEPFRFAGLFDPEPMEMLDCVDQTPFPLAESPEVVSLIEMYQEMAPGVEPIEYVFVDALVVGIEDDQGARIDVRQVYRVGIEGMACPDPDDPPDTARFRASGNEPFWSIEVGVDSLTLERPAEPSVRVAHEGVQGSAAAGWTVRATVGGTPLEMRLTEDGCRDSMAGGFFHLAASVVWGDVAWQGCGWQPVDDV